MCLKRVMDEEPSLVNSIRNLFRLRTEKKSLIWVGIDLPFTFGLDHPSSRVRLHLISAIYIYLM